MPLIVVVCSFIFYIKTDLLCASLTMEEQEERESMMKRRLNVNGLKNKERANGKMTHKKENWKEEGRDDKYEHKTNILKLSFDVHSNGLWGCVRWNDKKSLVSPDMDALNGSRTLLSSSWLSGQRWWHWYENDYQFHLNFGILSSYF